MRDKVEDRFFKNVEGGESIIVRLMYNLETMLMLGGKLETSVGDRSIRDYIGYNMEVARREVEEGGMYKEETLNIGGLEISRWSYSKKRGSDVGVSSILEATVKRVEENIDRYARLTNEILDGDDLMAKLDYTIEMMQYGGDLGKVMEMVMEMVENYQE